MNLLQFIFSSFWTFAGTVILIAVTAEGLGGMVSAIIAAVKGNDVTISVFSGNKVGGAKDAESWCSNDQMH